MQVLGFMKIKKVQSSHGQAELTQLLPLCLASWCHTYMFLNLSQHTWTEQRWGILGRSRRRGKQMIPGSLPSSIGPMNYPFLWANFLDPEQQLNCMYFHFPQEQALRGQKPEYSIFPLHSLEKGPCCIQEMPSRSSSSAQTPPQVLEPQMTSLSLCYELWHILYSLEVISDSHPLTLGLFACNQTWILRKWQLKAAQKKTRSMRCAHHWPLCQ